MLDKNKIRLMSRLAVYDKKFGAADRKKGRYFKWDYIYFRNFWTRAGVFSGCLIITLFYVLKKLLIDQTDILTINLKTEATKIGFFTVIALVVYTIIGTLVAKSEYKKSRERLEAYFFMLDKLDGLNKKESIREEQYDAGEERARWERAARDSGFEQTEPEPAPEPEYEPHFGLRYEPPAERRERREYASRAEEIEPQRKRSIDELMRLKEVKRRDGNTD